MNEFVIGQRWYSDSEPELGMGIIDALAGRQIQIQFPATGEVRRYASESAPLTRARFIPHDKIRRRDGEVLHIESVNDQAGLLCYHGHDELGHPLSVTEQEIDPFLRLNKPQDRLLNGQVDSFALYRLRYETLARQHALFPNPVWGLAGARVSLIPHQLYIAHEVANRPHPRVLLADEVGLGKTIEAGLILHKLYLTHRAQRILVVVPETLLHQWLVEMLRRFNLKFSLFDAARYAALAGETDNPFLSEQLVLCSLEFLLHSPARQAQALQAGWDLLVVDEAHHLHWSEQAPGPAYQFVEQLASQTPGTLLLTATPEQLGISGHFARLRLLDPHRFFSLDEFIQEEALYEPVVRAVETILDGNPFDEATRAALRLALGEHPTYQKLMQRIDDSRLSGEERNHTRKQLVHLLVDRHGTSRILFRNTRAAIQGFPQRQAHPVALPLPDPYAAIYAYSRKLLTQAAAAAEQPLSHLLTPEHLYRQHARAAGLSEPADHWLKFDPRVAWLIGLLKQLRGSKVLVICAQAVTALQLQQALREQAGLRAGVFHEQLSIIERDRTAAYFADPEQGAQVLICSEIGSEGRNFQFAHHLVLFDLPYNPDLLEQRIGRLDRIGQQQDIDIHIPYLEPSPQALLYRIYQDGLHALARTCATGTTIFEEYQRDIDALLVTAESETAAVDRLLDRIRQRQDELSAKLEAGRDRLLELNSYRSDEAAFITQSIQQSEQPAQLRDYLLRACDAFGVEIEEHSADTLILRPGDHMLIENFPGLPADGITATFDRAKALSHEDWYFLTWEHPLVQGVMDLIRENEYGNVSLSIIRHKACKTGDILLECNYLIEAIAPATLELERFLPPTLIRLVVDRQLQDQTPQFEFERLQVLPARLDKQVQSQIISAHQHQLRDMLTHSAALANAQLPAMLARQTEKMQHILDNEIMRLQHLQTINPNVRDEEITQRQTQREQLAAHIAQAQLRLDAARILIAS